MTAAARKLKYRTDAEFRAKYCAQVKAWRDAQCKDPLFRKLENARKAVYTVRESYHARLAHAERLFAKLQKKIAERDKIQAKWKSRNSTRKQKLPLDRKIASV